MSDLILKLGGVSDIESGNKRPTYCCIKDNKIDGIYWAIPTSDLAHRTNEQIQKYNKFIGLPNNDLRSCYYHIAKTTKESLYKVSSCFPVTDKYIDHEYTTFGKHVIMQNKTDVAEIERKLRKILSMEFRKNNYFPQHISDIRTYLIQELEKEHNKNKVEVA
jgi:hypothetical protein